MRKLVYYVGVSLDGYIAGPGGEFDFYFDCGPADRSAEPMDDMMAWITAEYPDTVPTHLRAQIGLDAPNRRFDTVLMGRGTYQVDTAVTSPYRHLKQYVVSTTIPGIDEPGVELVSGDPLALVRRLKKEGGMDIWLCGGGRLAGSLLPEIDELIVKSYPVVAGAGLPMVAGEFDPTHFVPTRSRSFGNGATVTWFTRR
ncbi:dihydrofolate reductase family protein [Planomonospora alba]|uniref:Dihydrofolate reductase family protein n=1 Tax=Planomonospora alba TaxID=161354 RepID=A0ABP6N0P6_9ACTN